MRKDTAIQKCEQARMALNRLANLVPKDQYQVNEKVWLDAKNLSLPYQMLKLAPQRHVRLSTSRSVGDLDLYLWVN